MWHRAIVDARLAFTILQGLTITFGFANQDELNGWVTMKLPNSDRLKEKIASMTTEKIRIRGSRFAATESKIALRGGNLFTCTKHVSVRLSLTLFLTPQLRVEHVTTANFSRRRGVAKSH